MIKIVITLFVVAVMSGCIKDTSAGSDINVVSTPKFNIYKANASDGTPCYVARDGSGMGYPLSMVCDFSRKP